jgi:serine/threonine protein kinase/Tol biopolymer transport system component
MALSPGTRLGAFEIVAALGAGGMGEVYRATDSRLGRGVAIKVLPAHLAVDPDARARFEREARAVAALSHPNILAIHDIGTDHGIAYAVMELLDGEALRARIRASPIPWRKAVQIALQVADGLAAAHAKHIVHRDLKPENIFLCSSGQAKILDFGLARIARPEAEQASVVTAVTQPGMLMGTVGYMSPEQIRGEDAGAASDVFSFGCVLYEMLSRRAPFAHAGPAETMAAALRDEPASLETLAPGVPPALEAIVLHCLEKRPEDRFQSARDMAFALTAIAGSTATASVTSASVVVPPASTRPRIAVVTAAVAIGAVLGGAAMSMGWRLTAPPRSSAPLVHLAAALPSGDAVASNDSPAAGSSVAISRDGRRLAYVVERGGSRRLAVRALDASAHTLLPGTEGAMTPIFSPDGEWIAFFTETGLQKIPVTGGTAATICPTPPVTRGAVWADDGLIYFSPSFSSGVVAVSAGGGRPRDVTTPDLKKGESNHLLPEVLPGSRTLLFTLWNGGDFNTASVWSVAVATGERKLLLESATAARYAMPGFLIFARNGGLFAMRFDPDRVAISGEAIPVVDGVWTDRVTGTAHFAVADNGTLVVVQGGETIERRRLVMVDRHGHPEPLNAEPNFYGNPRFSPDGRRVAVDAVNDIWIYALAERILSRVTFRGVNSFPTWAPDGRHVAFSSSVGFLDPKLYSIDVDVGGEPEPLDREDGVQFPGSWNPNGDTLAYAQIDPSDPAAGFDIWLLAHGKTPATRPLFRAPFNEDQPMFSPDGRSLAYVSNETGRQEVYLRSFPDSSYRIRISTDGGTEPVWSRRGREIFYRQGMHYFSVAIPQDPSKRPGSPALMFDGDYVVPSQIPGNPSYDVTPDGTGFIMIAPAGVSSRLIRIDVMLGWTDALHRRLPGSASR